MHIPTALAVGTLALQASAFLIPPNTADFDLNQLKPVLPAAVHTVKLDCPNCPFVGVGKDDEQWQQDVENYIHLEFVIDPNQGLVLNGQPIILSNPGDGLPSVVTAPQISAKDGQWTKPVPLDFALERLEITPVKDEPQSHLIPMKFTILGLQGRPVKVDTIVLDLVHTPTETRIQNVAMIPYKDTPGAISCDGASKWSLCRLRAMLAAHLQSLMHTAKTHATSAKGWLKGGCKGMKGNGHFRGKFGGHHGHHGEEGHHRGHFGHRQHGHHSRFHRVGRMIHQALRFVVIPALLGIIGGLMASAIGMLVGQFIVYLWLRFRRNHYRQTSHIVEVIVHDDEKDALMQEDLPPQYEDVEGLTVDDEKN